MSDRQEQQLTLWEYISQKRIITKPIRLIELFAGIGAQAKALEVLGVEFEHYKICEWAYNSYCGYNAIHIKDKTDYSIGKTKEELIERVKGTSINYNEPLTTDQLNKKSIDWLRNAYNNCVATHNLINIMEVHGQDLEIVDTDKYDYLMTYSFPCQDLSLAGKGKGMSVSQADGGTRSGLLWEVERILDELENKPQILIMENVPEVVGTKNIKDFKKWEYKLRTLGYSNFVEILNAKNYGIPQNRRRCFMISILGDYAYDFPCKLKLKYRIGDLLEANVDEKYFLSDTFLDYASGVNYDNEKYNRTKMFVNKLKSVNVDGISGTITTREGGRSNDTFIVENIGYIEKGTGPHQSNQVYSSNGLSPTLAASDYKEPIKVMVEDTLKRELCNELVKNGMVEEGDIVKHSYTSKILNGEKKAVEKSGEMITLTTRGDCFGVVVDDKIKKVGNYGNGHHAKDVFDPSGVSPTITTGNHGLGQAIQQKNLRIRKLTPTECMRLMSFQDKDTNALKEIGLSDAAIYHVAGDSIAVVCLIAIFSRLVEKNHIDIIQDYVERGIIHGTQSK